MDIAQMVAQSLTKAVNFCFLYLVVMVGTIFLLIGIFKFAAWIADRRCESCGDKVSRRALCQLCECCPDCCYCEYDAEPREFGE
jgi:predicted transporter